MATNSNSIGREGRFQSLEWWHPAVADWMLMNPDKIMRDCARHFNVSENYISLLTGSDMFKSYFEKRRSELIGEVRKTTMDRLKGLADSTIDCLSERIARERDTIALVEVRETMDSVLKACGYGQPKDARNAAPVVNNVIVLSADDLARARELMQQRRKAIDVEPAAPAIAPGL